MHGKQRRAQLRDRPQRSSKAQQHSGTAWKFNVQELRNVNSQMLPSLSAQSIKSHTTSLMVDIDIIDSG
jgi:hypothetical protein